MGNSANKIIEKQCKIQKPAWAARLKPSDPFFALNYFVEIEVDAINSFLYDAEKLMTIKENELNEKLEAWKAEKHLSPDAPDAYDMYESEIINVGHIPKLLYNSFFLTAYTCFEKRMFEICFECETYYEIEKSVKEVESAKGIFKCAKYLKKEVIPNSNNNNPLWEILTTYSKIRNAIAHNDCIIKESDYKPVLKHFSKDKNFEIDEKNKYVSIASSSFIKTFNTLYSKYLRDLTSEITKQKNL